MKILVSIFGLLVCLSGCALHPGDPASAVETDFTLPGDSNVDGAIVFVVDGINSDIFNEMLAAGELENFKKYFIDRGIYVPRAIANVPSVTLANLTSLATGEFCGDHGIIGINWFDRNRLIWRDYETIAQKNTLDNDYQTATIFERFGDKTTFSVFFQPHRGTTKFIENWTSAGPVYYFQWYKWVDRLTLYRMNIVADIAKQRQSWPAVTYCYLLAPDFVAYNIGVDSQDYKDAIIHADQQIGRLLKALKRDGIFDKLTIALISDHGHTPVKRHFDMSPVLTKKLGLKLAQKHYWEETPFEKRIKYYSKYNAVTFGSGDRYIAICLRKPLADGKFAPWPQRPNYCDLKNYHGKDIIQTLVNLPATDAIAIRVHPRVVRVYTKTGSADFEKLSDGMIAYTDEGQDPFGWRGKVSPKLLDGQPAEGRTWLNQTAETNYPDLPAQILAYFNSRYAGDIIAFAANDWDWDFKNHHKSGHGGLHPNDMTTILSIAGPNIPNKTIPTARTIDLVKTLLNQLKKTTNLKNAKVLE